MRKLALFPFFALLFSACGDGTIVEPAADPDIVQTILAGDQFAAPLGGMQFSTRMNFVGPISAGDTRITPSGVMHVLGVANLFEFAEVGPFEGTWTFDGKYHVNPKNGKGTSINMDGMMVLTEPGEGTFNCTVTGRLEGFMPPSFAFVQYGNFSGCRGTGDFEGMKMKGYFTNEGNPGVGNYDFWGVMW